METTPQTARKRRSRLPLILGVIIPLVIAGVAATIAIKYMAAPSKTNAPTAKTSPSTAAAPVKISAGRIPDLQLPDGYVVHVFAEQLGTPRDLIFSPGGTLLVSSPERKTVTALPDRNRDGVADESKTLITSGFVHGLAFHAGKLFVAETGRVLRYNWDEANLVATLDRELFKLPEPGGNHGRRSLVFDNAGKLYVSIGSTCNVCKESDPRYATIMQSDADGNNPHIFAAGLRNAPFMAVHPTTGDLWATEMGRDLLGDNIPPDEINIVRAGQNATTQNYGWPICYDDRIHDTQYDKNQYIDDPCKSTVPPIFKVPAHSAPLGLAFINSAQWPADQQKDLLVAYHGSWNRTVPDGYKVVRLKVQGNTITGSTDFLTGFIKGRDVSGRPVDVTFDSVGNLYVSDDKAGAVYIIQKPVTANY